MNVLELNAEIFGDGLAAGQGCDVLQHGLATIAEARSLNGSDLQRATQLVHDQGRQCFAVYIFGDDEQRLAALGDLFKQREQIFHRRDFLFVDQDVGVLLNRFHPLGIGDEVGREIAAIELHAFDHVELGLERLRLFDGDDAVLADLLHGFRDDVTDGLVVVGGDAANLGDHVTCDWLADSLVEFAAAAASASLSNFPAINWTAVALNAALQGHRIGAGGNGLDAFAIDRLGENGRGGGAARRRRQRSWKRLPGPSGRPVLS